LFSNPIANQNNFPLGASSCNTLCK